MPPRSPGANAVTKTSGSAATERGAAIVARAAKAKASTQRSVVIEKLVRVGIVRVSIYPTDSARRGDWRLGFVLPTGIKQRRLASLLLVQHAFSEAMLETM